MARSKPPTNPCANMWMDANVCCGNRFNVYPGVRHICDRPQAHAGRCVCPCGAIEKRNDLEKETHHG